MSRNFNGDDFIDCSKQLTLHSVDQAFEQLCAGSERRRFKGNSITPPRSQLAENINANSHAQIALLARKFKQRVAESVMNFQESVLCRWLVS